MLRRHEHAVYNYYSIVINNMLYIVRDQLKIYYKIRNLLLEDQKLFEYEVEICGLHLAHFI